MILIDSGPLIALLDDRDPLNRRAIRELKRAKGKADLVLQLQR